MLARFFSSSPRQLSKIYVGNIAWSANEDVLRQAFAKFGPVADCFIVKDRMSGRSKGFGFIEFQEQGNEAAEMAIKEMNEAVLEGRNLRVNHAMEKTRSEQSFA